MDKVGTWFHSKRENITVFVSGNRAEVYDGDKRSWTMMKQGNMWPKQDNPRGRIALQMVKWVEHKEQEGGT